MKTAIENRKMTIYQSKLLRMYFKDRRLAVFDLETTGLNPACAKIILSGILKVEDGQGQLIQYFAEEPEDEKEIVEKTLSALSGVDVLLTYNGRHFDLPFLRKRAARCLSFVPELPYTLDLYLILNSCSPFRSFLPDLKQKSVEVFLGLSSGREDEISGRESVELYRRYLDRPSPALEREILLHNHDDVLQLCRMLPVIGQTDFHRAMFSLGFPVKDFCITKMKMTGHDLTVLAEQTGKPTDYISFPTAERPFSLAMDSRSRSLELTIPGTVQSGCIICDAAALLGDEICRIADYPNVINGYLILQSPKGIRPMEINAMILTFFNEVLPKLLK